jgi:hypothetical protein
MQPYTIPIAFFLYNDLRKLKGLSSVDFELSPFIILQSIILIYTFSAQSVTLESQSRCNILHQPKTTSTLCVPELKTGRRFPSISVSSTVTDETPLQT